MAKIGRPKGAKTLLKELEEMTRTTYHGKKRERQHKDRMGDIVRQIEKVLGFRK